VSALVRAADGCACASPHWWLGLLTFALSRRRALSPASRVCRECVA
jgi:hypothetical protein